ncbi:alpha/beta hydrolase family protein [Haladaptatus sp. GCM10025707]|uniref:alpha/beta hydrolase family protein n=1 Tax=unclassified Haladaptatus TaxID=2622732 RepID=UPI0023E7648A|nr:MULTISPECIES: acetylxylan esterase [unclassified Haladaptatus]
MNRTFLQNVDGFYDVEDQLPQYLRRLAATHFERANRERDAVDSRRAARRHGETARANFFDALGGLPTERTPLNPTITDTLDRDGYRVELVVFESLPDVHVTANLYLPDDADEPVPGVLFFCGHSDAGKAAAVYQKACIELVQNGFAVLAVDPIGQGERHQFFDPETGEIPRRNVIEHSYLGHQCMLAGTNLARYFVWDAMRAMDYLRERPEVDPDRIGATGNSGGGMQTGYLMLADDRLAAAAPCCFVTSKEAYMKTGQAQDGEQIIWRAIERGPRYDDFLTGFAPKPVCIGASQSDFLCIEGAHQTYERAKRAYELYAAPAAIDLVVSPTTHGLDPVLREAVINWFQSHLQGIAPDFEAGDPETETESALTCLESGEVNAAFPAERHVVNLTREYLDGSNPTEPRAVADADGTPMRKLVRERFDLDRIAPPRFPRVIKTEDDGDLVWEKVFFRSESDIVTTGVLVRDERVSSAESVPTVVLLNRGTDDLPEYEQAVRTLATERGAVFVFDVRGEGGVRARDVNTPLANGGEYYDTHGTAYKLTSDALMCGTSLVALRVFDVLQAGDYLANRFGTDNLGVIGVGTGTFHALYAAVADQRFGTVLVEDVPTYYERATNREVPIDHDLLQFGVVGELDIPQLLPALSEREVTVTNISTDHFG